VEDRVQVLHLLGAAVHQVGGIPQERSFLDWEEIAEMSRAGMSFGITSHGYKNPKEISEQEFAADVHSAVDAMRKHEIPYKPIYCFPRGHFSKSAMQLLERHGMKDCVTLLPPHNVSPKENSLVALGRIPVFESVRYHPHVFACHIWRIRAFGYEF